MFETKRCLFKSGRENLHISISGCPCSFNVIMHVRINLLLALSLFLPSCKRTSWWKIYHANKTFILKRKLSYSISIHMLVNKEKFTTAIYVLFSQVLLFGVSKLPNFLSLALGAVCAPQWQRCIEDSKHQPQSRLLGGAGIVCSYKTR